MRGGEGGFHYGCDTACACLCLSSLSPTAQDLSALFAAGVRDEAAVLRQLQPWSRALLLQLPAFIRSQLLAERESQGGLQWSALETERLLAALCATNLAQRKAAGTYAGSFNSITSFFGYQAQSAEHSTERRARAAQPSLPVRACGAGLEGS